MNNINISNKEKIIYLDNFISCIYKILPLFEENNNVAPHVYIKTQILGAHSANNLFGGILIDLIVKLNILTSDDIDHNIVRKIVFECIGIIDKIKKELILDGENIR